VFVTKPGRNSWIFCKKKGLLRSDEIVPDDIVVCAKIVSKFMVLLDQELENLSRRYDQRCIPSASKV
jgi:hypothetical protein